MVLFSILSFLFSYSSLFTLHSSLLSLLSSLFSHPPFLFPLPLLSPSPHRSLTLSGVVTTGAQSMSQMAFLGTRTLNLPCIKGPTGISPTPLLFFYSFLPLLPLYLLSFHRYRLEWQPGESLDWYLDDEFLFGIPQEALTAKVSCFLSLFFSRISPLSSLPFSSPHTSRRPLSHFFTSRPLTLMRPL